MSRPSLIVTLVDFGLECVAQALVAAFIAALLGVAFMRERGLA